MMEAGRVLGFPPSLLSKIEVQAVDGHEHDRMTLFVAKNLCLMLGPAGERLLEARPVLTRGLIDGGQFLVKIPTPNQPEGKPVAGDRFALGPNVGDPVRALTIVEITNQIPLGVRPSKLVEYRWGLVLFFHFDVAKSRAADGADR